MLWTDAERARLRELLPQNSVRQIAAELCRSVFSIRQAVARQLGGSGRRADRWRDDEVALLQGLWPNHSAGAIARQLNRSRNAVIGQVYRLRQRDRVSMKPKSSRNDQHELTRTRPHPPQPRAIMPKIAPAHAIQCPCSLIELDPINCHWPYGDPHHEGFYFCGALVSDGSKYCARHRAEAHHPQGTHGSRSVAA